jgi:hypothetical protein
MQQPHSITIHEFDPAGLPVYYDDEGDQMIGFYFQFTDADDQPISNLVGPYAIKKAAEKAALRAFHTKDF